MRTLLLCLLLAAIPSWAQAPDAKAVPGKGACVDCGVVRSVKLMQTEVRPAATTEGKPSGLVATVPFGQASKAQVGSSTRVGKDKVETSDRWQVTILLDDGRVKLMTLNEDPDLREGDKVRIDKDGKIERR